MNKQLKFQNKSPNKPHQRILLGVFFIIWFPFDAMAVLTINPTRVLFEGRVRSETVKIINKNSYPTTYRVFFKNMQVLENGNYIDITTLAGPNDKFADFMLRYSPRQVTIEPGQSQSIRLLLRKPKELADGEYRSHLVVEEVPDSNDSSNIEKIFLKEDGISVSLIPRFSISIPVLVRHGTLNARTALDELSYQNGDSSISLKIHRQGNQSLFGDLYVTHVTEDGNEHEVGALNRIAVYTPNAYRLVSIPLKTHNGLKLQGGTLKIVYRSLTKAGEKILAEASLSLP